jgi:predicted transcriptional regulator
MLVEYEKDHFMAVKGNFFVMPRAMFEYKLSPRAIAVYTYLLSLSNKHGESYPSREIIAKKCCMSVPTVDKALKELIDKLLVEKSYRFNDNGQTSNFYKCTKI